MHQDFLSSFPTANIKQIVSMGYFHNYFSKLHYVAHNLCTFPPVCWLSSLSQETTTPLSIISPLVSLERSIVPHTSLF